MTCPGCGASVAPDAITCNYCALTLATQACPACFARMLCGCKHCPHCGVMCAPLQGEASGAPCPACKHALTAAQIGQSKINECDKCGGIWVNVETFRSIVADKENAAVTLGAGAPDAAPHVQPRLGEVHYRPCPACANLMNRTNFGRISGVIVDVCKGHGTWFDKDELRQAVEFIRAGGLDTMREREIAEQKAMNAPAESRGYVGHADMARLVEGPAEHASVGVSRFFSDLLAHLFND